MGDKTPRKRAHESTERKDYMGFLHHISPVKTSKKNVKYFNGVLQCEEDRYRDIIVYNERVHDRFSNAEKQKSPVKLANCSVLPSYRNPSQMDVRFGTEAHLSYVEHLDFSFRRVENKTDTKPVVQKTLEEVMSLELLTKINVTGQVCCTLMERECMMYGKMKMMKKVLLCDETCSIALVLWENLREQVEVGRAYSFANVVVKLFSGDRYLTSSPVTEVNQVDDIQCSPDIDKVVSTICGPIESVQVLTTCACTHCHNVLPQRPETLTYKCGSCQMRTKTSNLKMNLKCSFSMKCQTSGTMLNLNIEGDSCKGFIDTLHCGKGADDIEEALLCCDTVEVKHQNKDVVNIRCLQG